MHDRLFEAHGDLDRERLLGYAAEIGLNLSSFAAGLDGGFYREQVDEDFRTAVRYKIKSPPILFVNGILYEGPRTADTLRRPHRQAPTLFVQQDLVKGQH